MAYSTLSSLLTGIADAIRSKKGTTAEINAQDLPSEIEGITLATGNATTGDVLSGKTFSNTSGNGLTGTMANNGAISSTISAGGSYTIPAGYHNGSGKVSATANSGNASTSQVLSGATFYSNSATKQTGSMTNNGAVSGSVGVGGSYTIPAGYHNGSGKVSGPTLDGNASAANVLSGSTFYSNNGTKQTGTMVDRNQSSITYTSSNPTPVQVADAWFCDPNSDGVKRLCFRTKGIDGYYGSNVLVSRPLTDFGTATADQVKSGASFTSTSGVTISGTMPNNGAISATIAPGGSYTIPAGYHNGSGVVSASAVSPSIQRIVTQNGNPTAEAELTCNCKVLAVVGYGIAWGDGSPSYNIYVNYGSGYEHVYQARNSWHRSGNANPSTYWGYWANPSPNANVVSIKVSQYDNNSDSCVSGFIIKG